MSYIKPDALKEVIEGYFNGTNFYTDAAFTNLITPESNKIYVDLNTNVQYRWSGSAYVQIGGDNYDLGNWLVNRFNHQNSVQPYLLGNALAGGVLSASGVMSLDTHFKTMSGFVCTSSTSANSGYHFLTTSGNISPIDKLAIYGTFRLIQTNRDNSIAIGYGVYGSSRIVLEISTSSVTLRAERNGVASLSASETLVANVFYNFLIEKISNSLVKAKIKRTSDGVVVFDKTLTTNIPLSNSKTNIGMFATIATAGASQGIIQFCELSFGLKPNFLNDF